MTEKPTYEELKKEVRELEKRVEEHKNAEEKWNVLLSVFEQINHSIAIVDPEGKVEYVNPKLLEVYKMDPDQGSPLPTYGHHHHRGRKL